MCCDGEQGLPGVGRKIYPMLDSIERVQTGYDGERFLTAVRVTFPAPDPIERLQKNVGGEGD
jgi:hypothetical protein